MNRTSLVVAMTIALALPTVLGATDAHAQNAPTVQGMPPVSSPNAPATQTALPPPAVVAPPATSTPLYQPAPLPRAPTLTAPPVTPGGTSARELGSPSGSNDTPTRSGSEVSSQITALLSRPGGLTSDQVASRARETSYDVHARKAEHDAADAIVTQAGYAYVPRVKGTASYSRTSPVSLPLAVFNLKGSLDYPENNYNLQVDVDVPLSDYVLKVAQQHAGAEHSAKAAELTQHAAELTASSNARIIYYSWARARLNLVVAQASLDQTRQHLADAKAELAAGRASQADVLSVQAQVTQNELLVTRATNAVALEEDRLRTALHDTTGASYEIGEPLLADLPPVPGEENFNALLDEALAHRPEIRSITETAVGLHSQATASKNDVIPKIDGIGTAQYANPNPRFFPPSNVWNGSWAVGAALTWSDTDVLLGITNGKAQEARAQSAEAQAMSMRDGIRDEVLQSVQAVREAETAIRSTEDSLAASEESYRVRRALFRAERATSTDLSLSESALTGARFESVSARIDLRIARVRLAHAVGRDDATVH